MINPRPQPTPENGEQEDLRDKKEEHIITVLLVDDHEMVRQSMGQAINTHPEMKTIGTGSNGQEAIRMARETSPDVILMDVNMPVMDGIEATKKITAIRPNTCIIGLSLHDNQEVMDCMMRAGATGYVTKGEELKRLFEVIKKEIGVHL